MNIFSVYILANDSITLVYYHAMILSSSTLSELQIYFDVVIVRITKKRKKDFTKKINGNQVRMSEILRIPRTTLQNKLVKYNITKTNISTTAAEQT